jgi:hypothetical protein
LAFIDSKLAELRSANSAATLKAEPGNGTSNRINDQSRIVHPSNLVRSRAIAGEVEEVDLSTVSHRNPNNLPQMQNPTGESVRRRRRGEERDANHIARDALIDQIMQETEIPLYDRSTAQAARALRATEQDQDEVDNDTLVAEAFKAEFFANLEEQHRRRHIPAPVKGKAGAATAPQGPKLGGSRAQREKMKAMEEAKKAGASGVRK